MRLTRLEHIGDELALQWDDGTESFLRLEALRRACPCAACAGEKDILGNVYKGTDRPLSPAAFQLERVAPVGGYAIQIVWGDRHSTGLYSFEYLRRLAAATAG